MPATLHPIIRTPVSERLHRVLIIAVGLGLLGACGDSSLDTDVGTGAEETGGASTGVMESGGSPTASSGQPGTGTTGGPTGGTDDSGDTGDTESGDTQDDEEPGAGDGSRLQLLLFQPDSGPEQRVGVFDSELGIECAFRFATDGLLRCLPMGDVNRTHLDEASGDAVPVRAVNQGCLPTFLVDDDPRSGFDCEPTSWDVFEPGEFRDEVCNGLVNGVCTSTVGPSEDAPPNSGFLFLGDPVDPSVFVAGELVVAPADTRLRQRWLEAEDGARFQWDIYDSQFDRACAFATATDGQLRCLPVLPAARNGYLVAQDEFVTFDLGNSACPPTMMSSVDNPAGFSCETAVHSIYSVDGTAEEVCLAITNGQCSTVMVLGENAEGGGLFYIADEVIDPEEFVAGDPSVDGGGDRIAASELVTDDGFRVGTGLFDAERGEACDFSLASDGVRRCLPLTARSGLHYDTDAMGFVPYRSGNAECSPSAIVSTPPGQSFSCESPRADVYEVGGELDEICSFAATPTTCGSSFTFPADAPPGAAYYVAGDVIDSGQFVGGTKG